ncbi:MAG: phosphate ABC transporter permease [Isosphaera sp.]|nr:phosphate ABC transporter permease [Isosphaera sp.]
MNTNRSAPPAPPDAPLLPVGGDPPAEVGNGPAVADVPVRVIEATKGWRLIDFGELWRCRELLYYLALRDIKVRYKQTSLGAAWAVVKPLAVMLAFSIFFTRLARPDTPYALFAFAGLLPWMLFAEGVSAASGSVLANQHLVTKASFPRLLLPLSASTVAVVDFLIASGVLVLLLAWFGVFPGWQIVFAPFLVLGLICASVGLGILLSALVVVVRDLRHAVPFVVQLGLFLTPTVYMPADKVVSETAATWLPLNPAYGLIANFRRSVLGEPLDLYSLAVSGTVAVLLLVVGCLYFRRVERIFPDII